MASQIRPMASRDEPMWLDGRRNRRLVLVLLALLAAAGSLGVQHLLVPLLSGNLDEGLYIFQAEMLLDGMISLPADRYGEFFRPWLSGERDGRIFTEYQIGYPTLLAGADLVFGSMRVGLAAVAAWNVIAVHGLAQAIWRDRRTALWAACLVAASPMLVLHSGLFLTYVATVAFLASAGWAALVAVERDSTAGIVVSGLLLGGGLLIRPLDAMLGAAPLAALVVHRARRGGTSWARIGLLASAGAAATVPALLVTAWYNAGTTGSPFEFPNMAADPLNRFGFGTRRLVEGEPIVEYHVSHALGALRRNLWAVPSWTLGGPLLLILAGWGLARRGFGTERAVLLAVVVAFPAVYTFWWATRLSALDATNGIGPHYYVPTFLALGLLAARGIVNLVGHSALRSGGLAALLIIVTGWSIPDKLESQREVTAAHRAADDAIPHDLADSVVVIDYGRPYLLSAYPFLITDPALEDDVLYAVDRGRNEPLARMFPGRTILRLGRATDAGDQRFRLVCELPETCTSPTSPPAVSAD